MYRKTGQISLRKNRGKVANDYLTQTFIKILSKYKDFYGIISRGISFTVKIR